MSKSPRHLALLIILFGAMFIFGVIENFKGVTLPLIKTEFNTSYEQQGAMVSLQGFSYVLFCLAGGIIIGSFGVKKAFAAGYIFMILGIAAMVIMPGFWTVAGALVFVFAGFGLFEVSVNALATQVFTSRAALLMNLLHFSYGVGSSLSPRAAGAISAAMGWRNLYLFSLPLVLAFMIPSLFVRFPKSSATVSAAEREHEKTQKKKVTFFTALKTPIVWAFAITLGFMIVVELCSANWAGLYFMDVYNLDPKTTGAAFISNYYILFTLSRLLSGFAIEKIGYLRSLFIFAIGAILTFSIGFSIGAKGIYVLPIIGFCAAIFWPTTLATAMGYFGEDAPVMTSAIIVIAGAINSGVQFIIGLTNRVAGPAWGYRSCLVYAIFIFISLIVLTTRMRRTRYIKNPENETR